MVRKQGQRGKAKTGRIVRCPKCGNSWKTRIPKNRRYICCSICKSTFKQKRVGK